MKVNTLAASLLGLTLAPLVWAADPFVVKDIRVEGLQRTEPGTVFNYLPIKVGDTFNDNNAEQAVKALFATGFFYRCAPRERRQRSDCGRGRASGDF